MQRIFRFMVLLLFMTLLVSCDVFLFPHEGRWNPLDPDNELVEVNGLSLPVVRDGYVDEEDGRDFAGPILVADRNVAPWHDTLIQFDTTDLPEFLDSAVLELYATNGSGTGLADVYLIAESWDAVAVTWTQITSTDFVDTSFTAMPVLDVVNLDIYVSCDVTEYVVRMQETGKNFGFQLVSYSGHLVFNSSRVANPPRLLVWGLDIPD